VHINWPEILKKRDHLEVLDIDDNDIKINLKIWWEGGDWIHLAQNRDYLVVSKRT
jgi:hypothetical protein